MIATVAFIHLEPWGYGSHTPRGRDVGEYRRAAEALQFTRQASAAGA